MGIRTGDHIKPRGGVYHYRRVVPVEYRKAYGKSEETKTLETRVESKARLLEKVEDLKFEARIAEIRAARDPHAIAKKITEDMRIVDGARFTVGVGGVVFKRIRDAELSNNESQVVRREVLDYSDRLLEQQDELLILFREIGDIFNRAVSPDILQRFRSGVVSLARSMVEGASAPAVSDPGTHTLQWAWDSWVRAGGHTPGSVKQAKRHWRSFLAHSELAFLGDVRRRHIVAWRDTLIDSGEFAENSINQRLQLVTAILRTGWREAESLEPDLKKIKLAVGDSARQPWTRDEILSALRVLKPHSWQAWLFVISLTTSVRLGELVAALREWWKPERGFIETPKRATKKRKFHAIPLIECLRGPFEAFLKSRPQNGYLFDCPRPTDSDEPISNFASRSINRFLHDKGIDRVFHELRDTWIHEARHTNDVKKELWEIVSGHSAATASDTYGGEKPDVLMHVNEMVCRFVTQDAEVLAAVLRLVQPSTHPITDRARYRAGSCVLT
jgi:integrase